MSVSKSVIEKINKVLISKIEAGVRPWRKTWQTVSFDGMEFNGPINVVSKTHYRGINWIILSMHPSSIPVFLTFNQVKKLNGSVKAGASALPVIYFKQISKHIEDENGEIKQKIYPVLKYYNVFNIEDTTIDIEKLKGRHTKANDNRSISEIETPINEYLHREKISLRKSYAENYYHVSTDSIHMVDIKYFDSSEEYYSTLIHEAIHSTGHESRLNRLKLSRKKEDYAFEELIAEIGASYLTSHFGISNDELIDNSAAYLQSWLKALTSDPFFFYQAAREAQAAANYIINDTTNDNDDDDE